MNKVRTIIRESGQKYSDIDFSYPGGTLASANYSLAKLITIPKRKRIYFHDAEKHIEISLGNASDPLYRSNLLAIRGSIYAQMALDAKLTKPIYGLKALGDYKNTLHLREKHGAGEGSIGEDMTELGFLEFHLPFKKKNGLKRIEEGVNLMKSREDKGFLVRAMRKLSLAYKKLGRLEEAKKIEDDAYKLAQDEALVDQLAQLSDRG